tara:strand:- start:48 stop:617 length:570 start_codon:yes stop_codon:yes gene_type:complete
MALVLDGSANTITGLAKGGIPHSALAAGTAIQTVNDVLDTAIAQTTSGSTTYTITGLEATITLANAANKVLVQVSLKTAYAGPNNGLGWWLNRNTSSSDNTLAIAAADGNRARRSGGSGYYEDAPNHVDSEELTFLDTPGATGPHTYNIKYKDENGDGGIFYVNRPRDDADTTAYLRGISTITLTEIIG